MVTLIVPPGAEAFPISHGDRNFAPYRADHTDPASRWLVDVPAEAAGHFLHNGGFSVMPDPNSPSSPPPGHVRLKPPNRDAASRFEAAEDGHVWVLAHEAGPLVESFGFSVPGAEKASSPVADDRDKQIADLTQQLALARDNIVDMVKQSQEGIATIKSMAVEIEARDKRIDELTRDLAAATAPAETPAADTAGDKKNK